MTATPTPLPLRDIHLPEAVSWWPPAPGWWWLLAGLSLLTGIVWLYRRLRQKGALKRESLRELNRLTADYQHSSDGRLLAQRLSILLRRVAITLFPRRQVASLTGSEWLEFLDHTLDARDVELPFRQGVGRALVDAPYSREPVVDGLALLDLSRRWIARVTPEYRGPA